MEALCAGELTAEDFRISGETLRRQAKAAEAARAAMAAQEAARAAEAAAKAGG